VTASLRVELRALLAHVAAVLGGPAPHTRARLGELQTALDETHAYVDRIRVGDVDDLHGARMLACLHVLDQLQRLHERCEEAMDRAVGPTDGDTLGDERHQLVQACATVIDAIDRQSWAGAAGAARNTQAAIHARLAISRGQVLREMAGDALDVPDGTARLEAARWLERVSTHVARATL
jgi:phosphate:Na+ symporter